MTDNPTKSPRCDNAQSRLRARVFLARYAHLSLSETEGMTDDDLQTACENIAGFLQAELYRQKVPAPIRIEPPVIRRVDPEGLLEALSQPIGEPDSEHAMLRGKADAADALLAALGTEETEVALQRLDTLRTAAATLKTLDGILAVFPEPDAPSNEPAIVVRARAAADFQAELDKARTDWRRWIGVTTDLTKIAAAVHMQDAKTAAEVADAAVARIEALERDVQTQAGKIRELDAETKAITTERDAWRNALLGLAGMGLEEAGAKSPADVADLAWARVGRPARQRAESLKTDRDNFLAVLRCVGESLCVDLDGCRVSEFEPRLCNAIADLRARSAQLDKLIAVAREHGLALDPRDAGDCLGPWIAEQREQLNLERMAVARFHGAAEKDRAEREEQARELAWFRDLWGRIVGERPVVGAAGPLGSRYRLVEPHKLKAAAEVRDLPVAAIARARAVTEPGFWTDWLDELSREFRRLDGLRQGADDAYSKVSRVIDTLTAILKGENPPVVGNETALELVARGLVADREAHRAAERVLIEAGVPAVTNDEPYIVRLARGAVQAIKGAGRPTPGRHLAEWITRELTETDASTAEILSWGHGACETAVHLLQLAFDRGAFTAAEHITEKPETVGSPQSAEEGDSGRLDLSRLRTALAEIPTLTPQQILDAAAATLVEQRQRVAEMQRTIDLLADRQANAANAADDLTIKLEGAEAAAMLQDSLRAELATLKPGRRVRETLDLHDVLAHLLARRHDLAVQIGEVSKALEGLVDPPEHDDATPPVVALARKVAERVRWLRTRTDDAVDKLEAQLADAEKRERTAQAGLVAWRAAMHRVAALVEVEKPSTDPGECEDQIKLAL